MAAEVGQPARRVHALPPRVLVLFAVAVAVWVGLGSALRATHGARVTADEPQYLLTAISLAEDTSLDISDERADGRFRVFHAADLPQQEAPTESGRAVSPHDPLLPALLAGPVAVGGWLAAKLVLALMAGALAALLLWTCVVRMGVRTPLAVVVVGAFAAAAPLAVYGTQVYPELAAALAVAIAIACLTAPRLLTGHVLTTLLTLTALPWLSVKYAPVAVALAAVLAVRLVRAGSMRLLALAALAALASALVFAGLHQRWYGGLTPYAAGSHFTGGELTVMGASPDHAGRSVRLTGLLFDRSFGLAVWQPLVLAAVPGLGLAWRTRRRELVIAAVVLGAGWLNATFLALTMHGWWFPGRQVVVVMPAVVLLAAAWLRDLRAAMPLALAALAYGASVYAWLVAQGVFGGLTAVVSFETLGHPLWRLLRAVLPDYRGLSGPDRALHLVLTGAVLVVLVRSARRASRRRLPIDDVGGTGRATMIGAAR